MTKRPSRKRLWIILGLVCAALAVIGVMLGTRGQSAVVAPGKVRDRLISRAIVTASGGVAEVRARTEGRVLSVHVREGDAVKEGQLLAEIEADDLQAELARREAEKSAAAASVRSMVEGVRVEERTALEAEARGAKHDFELAEDRAKRIKSLRQIGGGTEAEEQESQHAVEIARARLEAAEARLKLAKAGGKSADVRALEARVAAAEASITEARTGLSRTRLVAPVAGVVLARRVDAGDTITAASIGQIALFEIADIARTEIRVEVEETDAMRVAAGLPVALTMPGGGDPVARGHIGRVGARLERRTIGVEDARVRADAQVRAVWVEGIDSSNLPMGQRLEAVIELPLREVPAMAPRGAVKVRDGQAVVTVPWGPITRSLPVKLGAVDDKNVELIGVEAGTKVVVSE